MIDTAVERKAGDLNGGNHLVKKRGSGYPLPHFFQVPDEWTAEPRLLEPAKRALNGQSLDVTTKPVLLTLVRTFRTRSDLSVHNPAGRS